MPAAAATAAIPVAVLDALAQLDTVLTQFSITTVAEGFTSIEDIGVMKDNDKEYWCHEGQ